MLQEITGLPGDAFEGSNDTQFCRSYFRLGLLHVAQQSFTDLLLLSPLTEEEYLIFNTRRLQYETSFSKMFFWYIVYMHLDDLMFLMLSVR